MRSSQEAQNPPSSGLTPVNRPWRTLTKHQHSKPFLRGIEFRKNEAVNSRTAGANTGTYAAARCTIARRPDQGTWADPTRSARWRAGCKFGSILAANIADCAGFADYTDS